MRRLALPLLVAGCLLSLVMFCYGGVLFQGRQFAYRDAAHFYYPLYERVEKEWDAHRWPLWEPEENAGMPLLGNPTAAVLYPGKLIYRVLPYPWGARLYVVAHTVLAFVGMLILLRSWGTSVTGSALGALAYAFGAPILFQYCNIIFLVGAAWTPLGFRGVDRWLRLGRRWALIELAVVLAMQVLGGDPESAYLTGVCAGGYALGLAWWRGRKENPGRRFPTWRVGLGGVLLAALWVGATLAAARWLPAIRPRSNVPLAFPWIRWVPLAVLVLWGCVGLFVVHRWLRRGRKALLVPMLAGLVGAAAFGAAVAAAQLLPVLEFTGQSGRAAGGGPHDIFPFSLEPIRMVEWVWPNVFGTHFEGNRSWLSTVPPRERHAKIWVPSLYLGGLTIVLALGGLGFREGPPWRGWLTAIAVVSLLGSLGEYSSPIWWARWVPSLAAEIGPHDPLDVASIRQDRMLRDGDGSIYWLLATALPGFRQFRFPSKLLSFTALALAALSGLGWDRLMAGRRWRMAALAAAILVVTAIVLGVITVERRAITAFFEAASSRNASPFGPLDVQGAFAELRRALIQGATVAAVALILSIAGTRRPVFAAVCALIVSTADLGLANARYIFTVAQEVMDKKPKVIEILEAAERENSSPGPYRVHRMPLWEPISWTREVSTDRVKDFVVWERDTIQPKYGLPYNVEYTHTLGVAELWDFDWFFGGFYRKGRDVDPSALKQLGVPRDQQIVVYPRRAFDLWNTRYFVFPAFPNGWNQEHRGFAVFLHNSEPIYPTRDAFRGPDSRKRQMDWIEHEDLQVYRNKDAYPRAWIVHGARYVKPITHLDRTDREGPMLEMLYQNDPFWNDPSMRVFDPKAIAWMDSDKERELAPYLPGTTTSLNESVTVKSYTPQRIELEAVLEHPGLVILADVYYPGWRLTIEGKEAPVYRANRMMRGAAVKAGKYRLVYTFDPESFRLGGRITLGALAGLVVLGVVFTWRPVASRLAPREEEG